MEYKPLKCANCGEEIHGAQYWVNKTWWCLNCFFSFLPENLEEEENV